MAPSEIDDIFAAKKSVVKVVAQPTASTSTSTDATGSKKKKKEKKRKRPTGEAQDPCVNEEKALKKRLVLTVYDPSTKIPLPSSSAKAIKCGKGIGTSNQKVSRGEKEDLDRFKDSRGTGPRERLFSRDILP